LVRRSPPLREIERYASVLFDLDGTLYLSGSVLPGAAEFVAACRSAGLRPGFITNSSYERRAWHLERLNVAGIAATEDEMVGAADAVALALRQDGVTGVAVIGGPGLHEALEDSGLNIFTVDELDPVAVDPGRLALAVGIDPGVTIGALGHAARLIEAGLPVYAVSNDPRYPTAFGLKPGTGTMTAALRSMIAFEPVICGKPSAIMGKLVASVLGERGPTLMIGDSLVTDVPFAVAQGWDSLLVLTGSTTPQEAAEGPARPTFVEHDLHSALRHGFTDGPMDGGATFVAHTE
jgi:glycerol 3-phosphatase-2